MLTAATSHDMITPLNAIIGLLSNLQNLVEREEAKKLLAIISNSAEYMLYHVNDMLDVLQIKNKKFVVSDACVDLKASINDLVQMFSLGATEKEIRLVFKCDNDFPSFLQVDE